MALSGVTTTVSSDILGDTTAKRPELLAERRLGLPAWLLSVVMHVTIFVALGLLAPASRNRSPGEAERAIGIVLVQPTSSGGPYYADGASANDLSAPVAADLSPAVALQAELQADSGIRLPTEADGGSSAGGSIGVPNAAGLTQGGERRGQGVAGGKTRTQVFGARGDGNTFVYVFDRSSSMAGFGGRPLSAAKAELQRSLGDLVTTNQFQIVFYNEQPTIFNPFRPNPPKLLFATEENKQLARDYVQSVMPAGGTEHRDALQIALRMRPDVIFFLTDAAEPELTASDLADVRRRNQAASVIHAIEFGSGPFPGGENFLTRLARQNGGQHVYVDVTSLPKEG